MPGTYDRRRNWELIDNPSLPSDHGDLTPACHDGSPFLTILCSCGDAMHIHETQIANLTRADEVHSRCRGCHKPLVLGGDWLLEAFAAVKQAMKATA